MHDSGHDETERQRLADRAAVHDLLVRLAPAQDAKDWAALDDWFVPDARYVHPGAELTGVDDIVGRTRTALAPRDGNPEVTRTSQVVDEVSR